MTIYRRRKRAVAPALFIRGLADSQIAAQVGGCSIDRPLEIERRHEPAHLVHKIYDGRVVHGVAPLIEWDLFEIDPEAFATAAIAAGSPVRPERCGSKLDR